MRPADRYVTGYFQRISMNLNKGILYLAADLTGVKTGDPPVGVLRDPGGEGGSPVSVVHIRLQPPYSAPCQLQYIN